jgi:hypothetical protein
MEKLLMRTFAVVFVSLILVAGLAALADGVRIQAQAFAMITTEQVPTVAPEARETMHKAARGQEIFGHSPRANSLSRR